MSGHSQFPVPVVGTRDLSGTLAGHAGCGGVLSGVWRKGPS